MTAAAAAAAAAVGSLSLALAKLLFQEGRKPEAFELCAAVFTRFEAAAGLQPEPEQQPEPEPEQQQQQAEPELGPEEQSVLRRDAQAVAAAEAAEAYQLGGWVKIHSDDHSSAYSVWSRGHAAVPTCPFLARQAGKRACWDGAVADLTASSSGDGGGSSSSRRLQQLQQRDAELARRFVGAGAHGDGCFDRDSDLEAFAVPENQTASALALFDEVRKRISFAMPFYTKSRSFYQDRLGTNIGKAPKKREMRFSYRRRSAVRLSSARGNRC